MDRRTLFAYSKQALAGITPSPYQEALTLLSFVLGLPATHILSHLECLVSEAHTKAMLVLIKRRLEGEPLAYLKGYCAFWSASLRVTPDCLIPRQETELLIEKILAHYSNRATLEVLELGTGSGAIAITLSLERPDWQITATDQSLATLKIAEQNAHELKTAVCFRQGNWFKALDKSKRFDVIVSNPPYLSHNDPHLASLRYEPKMALVGGEQGTEALHHLIQEAPNYLKADGYLWLEQGFDQAQIVSAYLEKKGYQGIQQYCDLQGIIRVSCGKRPPLD